LPELVTDGKFKKGNCCHIYLWADLIYWIWMRCDGNIHTAADDICNQTMSYWVFLLSELMTYWI